MGGLREIKRVYSFIVAERLKGGNVENIYKVKSHQGWALRSFTFFSVLKKERSLLFRFFLEFLATYETQKNVT